MSDKVMVTIHAPEGVPTLQGVMRQYGLSPQEIDSQYGVIEIDPTDHAYSVLIDAHAAARIQPGFRKGTEGPFSNPKIGHFGLPGSE